MGIKKLAPGRYQVRVNRRDPKTGRKVNRACTVTGTRRDAEVVLANLRDEVLSTVARPQRLQLASYAAQWMARRQLKATTRRRYEAALKHITPALGHYYVDSLTPELVQDYVNRRLRDAEGNTVLNELRLLRTMAKDAHAARLSQLVFTDRVRAPKVRSYTRANPNRLTSEQFVATFANLAPAWKPMALLMVTTGLRWGEASALRGADVRLWTSDGVTAGEATVRMNNDRGRLVPKPSLTKGGERTVPLVPEVVFLLRPALARAKRGPIFVSRHGRVYASSAQFNRALWAAERAAGVPYRVKPHGLRRTWKNIAKHHASREVLKAIGGWSTDEMLEHYDHVESDEKMAAASAVIGSLKGDRK